MSNNVSKWVMVGVVSVITADKIIYIVSNYFNVSLEDIKSRSRKRDLVNARFFIIYYLRKCCNMRYSKIGKIFNRDHSTAIHAYNQVMNLIEYDEEFRNDFIAIGKKIHVLDSNCIENPDTIKSTTTLKPKFI